MVGPICVFEHIAEWTKNWRTLRLEAVVVIQKSEGHWFKQEWWITDSPEETDARDT